jgi:ABC-type transport system involved in multi-copper enzyme maturation permease subunit
MNSVWRSLLWKEWREHRWILALIIAGCGATGLLFVALSREWYGFVAGGAIVLGFGVPGTAMFVGAGIAARERSQRTLGFMQALPASMKWAAAAKLLIASATVMVPSLLAYLVIAAPYAFQTLRSAHWPPDLGLNPHGDDLIPLGVSALICGAAAVSLLIWMAAAGVNHVDELRAGAVGLLVIATVWGTALLTASALDEAYRPVPTAIQRGFEIVMAGAPGGFFVAIEKLDDRHWQAHPWQNSWPEIVSFLVSHGMLAAWYVVRLGRGAKPQAVGEGLDASGPALYWLNSPRRTRAGAIVWKQFRESAPLAAMGGFAILVISPIVARGASEEGLGDFIETWQFTAITTWLMAGVFVAVVAGIGVFYDDLRAGLHTFWRSRPIDVDAWFWTKLVTGLAVTVSVLAAGPLLTLAGHWLTGQASFSRLPQEPSLANVIGAGLLLHSATFVLAALAIVLVRQPVMAAMLTFGAWIVIVIAIAAWLEDDAPVQMAPFVWIGVVGLATWSILAWQALRRDWGWGGTS